MRPRAILFALIATGLAALGGAAVHAAIAPVSDASGHSTALARAVLADAPAPVAVARARDATGREHGTHRHVAVELAVIIGIALAGSWWVARTRVARVMRLLPLTACRTRAPPARPVILPR